VSTPDGLDYFGQFAALAPVMALYEDIRTAYLDHGNEVILLLPDDVMPGVTQAWGLRVIRGGEAPTLGLIPPRR
jgi:hypothetical protein